MSKNKFAPVVMTFAPGWRILATDAEIALRVFSDARVGFRAVLKDQWVLELRGYDVPGVNPTLPWIPTGITEVARDYQDANEACVGLAVKYLSSFDWKQSYGDDVVFSTPAEVEAYIEEIKDDPSLEDDLAIHREILRELKNVGG